MSHVVFRGEVCPLIGLEKMTPGEVDAVERMTGLTLAKIRFRGSQCACDHPIGAHTHKDDEGEVDPSDQTCTVDDCPCDEFSSDVPMSVNTALTWVSVKRVIQDVKFSEVADTPMDQMPSGEDAPAVVVEDPTPTPHEVASVS